MRGKIIKRDEQLAALSKQVDSPFVPFEIYSEEKMQYVTDGLTRAKIPFIEESRLQYIPEYAVKTSIGNKSVNFFNRIFMDIDGKICAISQGNIVFLLHFCCT